MSLVDKFFRQVRKRGKEEHVKCVVTVAVIIAVVVYFVLYVDGDEKKLTTYKPEIRLNSLIACSTNSSSDKVMFWDLRFNISNPNNYSAVYTRFEVSIFSFNQTKLLTKTAEIAISAGAKDHTSGIAYAEASLEDIDALDQTKGTIRFDLKFNAVFHFRYGFAHDVYHSGDLVCGDAKVLASSSSNKGAAFCGSLVGDPLACSYQSYYKKSFWQYYFLD